MDDVQLSGDNKRLREQIVKEALAQLDWNLLKAHLEDIELTPNCISELCGHIQRCTDLICKYPREDFEKNRSIFFRELNSYIFEQCGIEAMKEITSVISLIERIERGYRSILNSLSKCEISKQPAAVRVAATINRACSEYKAVVDHFNKIIIEMKQFELVSSIRFWDDNGNSISPDAILEGLSGLL